MNASHLHNEYFNTSQITIKIIKHYELHNAYCILVLDYDYFTMSKDVKLFNTRIAIDKHMNEKCGTQILWHKTQ